MATKFHFLALSVALCLSTGTLLQADSFPSVPPATASSSDYKSWMDGLENKLQNEAGSSWVDASPATIKKLLANPAFSMALFQWKLLKATGPENLQTVAVKDNGQFLKWLLSNPAALEAYLASGPLDKEGTSKGLEIWQSILAADPAAKEGIWSRVAIATALSHTIPVKALADGGEIDPLARYQRFKTAHAEKKLFPCFDQEAVWELRFVMNAWAYDPELDWVTAQTQDEKRNNQAHIGDACGMVPYRGINSKGVSVQDGSRYYDYLPVTLQLMQEVGGVCGAISRFGTNAAQARGVPAMPVGQPGHCAFLWKDTPTNWRTGNDIEGWAGSSEHGGIHIHWGNRGSYVLLMEEAHRDPAKFTAADQACWLGDLVAAKDARKATSYYQSATTILPFHAGAWQQLIDAQLKDEKIQPAAWAQLAGTLARALTEHPLPMIDLLEKIEPKLGFTNLEARQKYVSMVAKTITSGSKDAQRGCGRRALFELIQRQAEALWPDSRKAIAAVLAGKEDAKPLTPEVGRSVASLAESAVSASAGRSDLQDGVIGKFQPVMTADPASLARSIKFFGDLFEQAKTNSDRKPAIALARRIILLAEQAEDLAAMEKYSEACKALKAL